MEWIALASALIGIGLISYLIKRLRLREIQVMFRRYNDSGNPDTIIDWIRAGSSEARMVRVLDYLQAIEEEDLLIKVYTAFPPHQFKGRHTRIFACRAYSRTNKREDALEMARTLMKDYQTDDAILELYLETLFHFEEIEEARGALTQRLARKFEGTKFLRFKGQLLAADGQTEEAIKILEDVAKREHILSVNTFAQPQKRQIYEQYVETQTILNRLTGNEAIEEQE